MKLMEIATDNNEFEKTKDWFYSQDLSISMSSSGNRINVGSKVNLSHKHLTEVPVKVEKCSTEWNVSYNNISTIEKCGLPKYVPYVDISGNPIKSLIGINDIVKSMKHDGSYSKAGIFGMYHCPIVEGGLGLMLIEGISTVWFHPNDTCSEAFMIINECISKKVDIFECQSKLLEAGFEEFARI